MMPTARLLLAALLGVAAAVLVSCGGTGNGLIPAGNASPLENDFQAVAQAALQAGGSCGATESAIQKTESDLHALPADVNAGLRKRLQEGTANLAARARKLCAQPLGQSTTTTETTTTEKTTPAKTAPAKTTPTTSTQTTTAETEPTPTTETQSTAPTGGGTTPSSTTPAPGGGVQAPGNGEGQAGGEGAQGNGQPAGGPGHAEGGAGGGTGVEQ